MQTMMQTTTPTMPAALILLTQRATSAFLPRPLADYPAVKTVPGAERRTIWATYADIDRQPRALYIEGAIRRYEGREAVRQALRPVVDALLARGLTGEECRRCSRKGIDLLGAAALDNAAFSQLCLTLEDLSFEWGPVLRVGTCPSSGDRAARTG